MANTIQTASVIQKNLDKAMVQQSVTGWMEENAGDVIYDGGAEIKIPKIAMDGLGNYDRNNGFTKGSLTFEYETRKMTQDRGRSFSFDSQYVNETNYALTAARVMGEFQRIHVTPEVDAYRLSELAKKAIANENADYSYTPKKTDVIATFKNAIAKVRDNNFNGILMVHCTNDFKNMLEQAMVGTLNPASNAGSVNTQIYDYDGCLIIPTSSDKMVSGIKILDGKTGGQEKGGFEKADGAVDMNFIIIAREVPIAVSKTDKMRIFDPSVNQDADAWKMDYRKFHDLWVLDNKIKGIYANFKGEKPVVVSSDSSK